MNDYNFVIDDLCEGERLDKGISILTDEGITRSYLQKIIKDKSVFVNGKAQKSSYILKYGDNVTFTLEDKIIPDIVPEDIPLNIIYEDNDVVVVNKPKGMVVHPAPGHYTGTMVNALMYHCQDSLSGINGVLRPGIVHRIDMNTTGSVIVCKNDVSHIKIAEQLKAHTITRKYRAIVFGVIKEDNGTIKTLIGRDEKDRKKMSTRVQNGKEAITHYKVLERFSNFTYIECQLETGRTHQIRVHMSSIGHPLLGDDVYTNQKSPYKLVGQTLHAYILGFISPSSGEYIETVAPLPDYFQQLLEKIK